MYQGDLAWSGDREEMSGVWGVLSWSPKEAAASMLGMYVHLAGSGPLGK
jgi:hypothetical protein